MLNLKLNELYLSKWDSLCSAIRPILENNALYIKPTNPLLLYFNNEEEFKDSDIKLMIYGQETNDRGQEFDFDISSTYCIYDDFFNTKHCYKYGGQFWNGVSRFRFLLQKKYPNKKIHLMWNNIVKIGKKSAKGFPPDYIYKAEQESFHIISDELQIVKPDVVLFFTGPNYDTIVQNNFGKLEYNALEPFSAREISRLSIENIPFVFRTYHPNYLWRNNINKYLECIINKITI